MQARPNDPRWREQTFPSGGGVSRPLHLFGVALQFLTRLPVRVHGYDDGDLGRAVGVFPLVGLVVAAVGIGVRAAAGLVLSPQVASVLAVAAMVLVTGAFHEDGLADAFDGLWGGHTPERRLEIMRDSRLGTYGTVALVIALGLRVALLADLALADFARAVCVGHVLGRASSLLLVRLSPAIASGSGARVAGGGGGVGATVAGAATLITLWVALGVAGVVPLAIGIVVTGGGAAVCTRRLGGVNGDTLGAVNQIVHISAMAAVVALVGR